MKYQPEECPKCGAELEARGRGGRPSRWCCEGCRRAGEAEMARLQRLLVKFEEGAGVQRLNGTGKVDVKRATVIADMQARFDHLAGVPLRENRTDS